MKTSNMWLIYADGNQQVFQHYIDTSYAGVPIDDNGEDMELIGWTDEDPTRIRSEK